MGCNTEGVGLKVESELERSATENMVERRVEETGRVGRGAEETLVQLTTVLSLSCFRLQPFAHR